MDNIQLCAALLYLSLATSWAQNSAGSVVKVNLILTWQNRDVVITDLWGVMQHRMVGRYQDTRRRVPEGSFSNIR